MFWLLVFLDIAYLADTGGLWGFVGSSDRITGDTDREQNTTADHS